MNVHECAARALALTARVSKEAAGEQASIRDCDSHLSERAQKSMSQKQAMDNDNELSSSFREALPSRGLSSPALHQLCGLLLACCVACGSSPKAKSAPDDDTLVPQRTQREAERSYGQQQMMMNDLNQTPSESAGSRHDTAVERSRAPEREN